LFCLSKEIGLHKFRTFKCVKLTIDAARIALFLTEAKNISAKSSFMLGGMLTLYKAIFMTERIQISVESIKGKIATLLKGLTDLKIENTSMSNEIQSLKNELQLKVQTEQNLQSVIDNLNQEIELANKQVIELSQKPVGRTEEEIDELVKEIDYCIEQLKK